MRWLIHLYERHKRKVARKARAEAARRGESARIHRQYLNDPLMRETRR